MLTLLTVSGHQHKKILRDTGETGGFLIEPVRIFECFLGQGQGFSGEKKQRKTGIYQKSVKKEGCEFARNAVLSKNVLPLYIFDSRFMQAKRKRLNALFFHACCHIKRCFSFILLAQLNPCCSVPKTLTKHPKGTKVF